MDATSIGMLIGVLLLAIALIALLVCRVRRRNREAGRGYNNIPVPLDSVGSRRGDTLDLHGKTAAGAKAEFESFPTRDRPVLSDSRLLSTEQTRPGVSESVVYRARVDCRSQFSDTYAKSDVGSFFRQDRSVSLDSKPLSTEQTRPGVSESVVCRKRVDCRSQFIDTYAKSNVGSFFRQDRSVFLDSKPLSTDQTRPGVTEGFFYRKRVDCRSQFIDTYAKSDVGSFFRQARSVSPDGRLLSTKLRRRITSVPRQSVVDRTGDTLDYHGIMAVDARARLAFFLREARWHYNQVYVITGRGLHSEDGIPVIRNMVQKYLKEHNYKYTWMNKGGKLCIYL